MLKNILKLEGAQSLTKQEQLNVSGATRRTPPSLCDAPLLYCAEGREYDPCGPITSTNYPC